MVLALWAVCTSAIHHIRAGASGAASGADWVDAYIDLPANLSRGDTFFIADGEYGSGYNFNDNLTGTDTVFIIKATEQAHGSSTGWLAEYGDGKAVWDTTYGPCWNFSRGYYFFDGAVGGRDTLDKGFELRCSSNSSGTAGGCVMAVFSGSPVVSNLIFKNITIIGAGSGLDITPPAYCRPIYFSDTTDHITFHKCSVLRYGQQAITAANMGQGWTISDCYFKNGGSGAAPQHSVALNMYGRVDYDNIQFVVKNSIFMDFMTVGGSSFIQLGEAGATEYSFGGVSIHGNVFISTRPGTDSASALINNGGDGANHHTHFYNNTIINLKRNMDNISFDIDGGNNYATNNLYYNCENPTFTGCVNVNNLLSIPSDTFNVDFTLKGPLPGADNVDSLLNIDPLGYIRGSDGVVDYGAYEYNSKSKRIFCR